MEISGATMSTLRGRQALRDARHMAWPAAFDAGRGTETPSHRQEADLELWVPAEELDALNSNIVGPIQVVHEFR